jgi:hypothetical protein
MSVVLKHDEVVVVSDGVLDDDLRGLRGQQLDARVHAAAFGCSIGVEQDAGEKTIRVDAGQRRRAGSLCGDREDG